MRYTDCELCFQRYYNIKELSELAIKPVKYLYNLVIAVYNKHIIRLTFYYVYKNKFRYVVNCTVIEWFFCFYSSSTIFLYLNDR